MVWDLLDDADDSEGTVVACSVGLVCVDIVFEFLLWKEGSSGCY